MFEWLSNFFGRLAYASDKPADLTNFKCRFRGHLSGEIFYNPGGLEPNHHCQDCGEDIG